MSYKKIFSPKMVEKSEAATDGVGDQREGSVYVYTDDIILAVNVALATRRPLLVRGQSGGGKSSLARNVANVLNYRYYETVVSSRTQARDLQWEVDLLRRLHDAQIREKDFSSDMKRYVTPGPLWWAFDRKSAIALVGSDAEPGYPQEHAEAARAVVLLDEIDKADPDVPNNLLVPLGSLQFTVEETLQEVKTTEKRAPLVFITTNDERELPAAFLRRCVEVKLPDAADKRLVAIGKAHFPKLRAQLLQSIAKHMSQTVTAPGAAAPTTTTMPSPAEYLDTLRACDTLEIKPESPDWKNVVQMTLWKHGRSAPKEEEDGDAAAE
ncbi:MAG TPA: MoxR family ATPase [Pyrinomonadaceae bacterium]|jgi:MoxR-like ATPase|nr:MoxR family ATPase [Pyrinomonadaceae bacterium]